MNGDGTYRIDFDDGDVLERVLERHVVPREAGGDE